MTAAVVIVWEIMFWFIYRCFFQKYEEQLINAKKIEACESKINKSKDLPSVSTVNPADTDIRLSPNPPDTSIKRESQLQFEKSSKYQNNQITGVSRL